jgi:hypothetical protein
MIRVVLAADGIPATEGEQAAIDIAKEFNEVRTPRYINATCAFDKGILTLSCDNDGWDAKGLNLMDEFSDCLCAYVVNKLYGDIRFISAEAI